MGYLALVLMHRTEQQITFYGHFIPKKYNQYCIVAWILRVRMTKARSPTLTTSVRRDGDTHVLLNGDRVNRPRASSRSNSASRSTTRRWVAGSRCRAGVDISEGSNKAPGQAGDQRRDRDQRKVSTKIRDSFYNIEYSEKVPTSNFS